MSDTRFVSVLIGVFFTTCFLLGSETIALMRLSIEYDGVSSAWWLRYLGPWGAVLLGAIGGLIYKTSLNLKREAALEVPLEGDRHSSFIEVLNSMLKARQLQGQVNLYYLPWSDDANAYVTKKGKRFKLVVTRGMFSLHAAAPEQACAILYHEISHIEADDVAFTNRIRYGATAALLAIMWACSSLVLVYAVRKVSFNDLGNDLPVAGAFLISWTAPSAAFLYYREYLIGREYLHDIRAAQLAHSADPLLKYLESLRRTGVQQSLPRRILQAIRHFRAFHPTPSSRIANLESPDPYRAWSVASPFFAGTFLALLPIELALASAALDWRGLQKPVEWALLTISSVLLLQSDIARLAIYAVLRRRAAIRVALFFFLVLVGALVAVTPFIALSALFRGRALGVSLLYSFEGIWWTAIGYCSAAFLTAYVWALRSISSYGRKNARVIKVVARMVLFSSIVFFLLVTLSRGKVSLFATTAWILMYVASVVWTAVPGKCPNCSRFAWDRLWLKNRCSLCARDRLPTSNPVSTQAECPIRRGALGSS